MSEAMITLHGGPYDGVRVPKPRSRSLLLDAPGQEGVVARYRVGRDYVWRFKELDRIVARIPQNAYTPTPSEDRK